MSSDSNGEQKNTQDKGESANASLDNNKDSNPDELTKQFNFQNPESYEAAYQLEPFLLEGEALALEFGEADDAEKEPSGEFDREALLEAKLKAKLAGRVSDDDDQVDTIPPETAPNMQIENQIEMKKSGVFAIPDLEETSIEEKVDTNSRLTKFLDSFLSQKKDHINLDKENDLNLNSIISNRFRIEELIGRNFQAYNYKVLEVATGEVYAAKTTRSKTDNKDINQLESEIELQLKLKHENIVEVIEKGKSEDGQLFSIFHLTKGLSVKDLLILNGPITNIENFWLILGPICDALAYAHRLSIVHGNLQPGNIIITKEENKFGLKLLDFGLSSVLKLEQLKQIGDNQEDHTFLYLSPEQCKGEKQSTASDIYNLGILAYELVTGEPPFFGSSAKDIVSGHLSAAVAPKSLSTFESSMPLLDQLERIIVRALDADPDMRIASALEFKLVLKDWFERAKQKANTSE